MAEAITILELNKRLSDTIARAPGLRNVWVVGETSDVRVSTHCYLELLQKDENGNDVARIRANIWANVWRVVSSQFFRATGRNLTSGMKIMACVTANYHPNYGMSLIINAIDPSYTLGDAVARRNEILGRLQREGLLEIQRGLRWAAPALRIAVISAQGAAGYGDFINQIYGNAYRLNFSTRLYPAAMQGERTVGSVMEALRQIAAEADRYDGVVIIRGGGATSDLAAFDNYDLAVAIARFPIPVIVGIGHERDVTVLDYVANMRVKTPTAAAEWLIQRGKAMLDWLSGKATAIYRTVSERMAGDREMLARLSVTFPGLVQAHVSRNGARLDQLALMLAGTGERIITPRRMGLDRMADRIADASRARIESTVQKLDSLEKMVNLLSPQATLRRGYSITFGADGHAVKSVADVEPGAELRTMLADGQVISSVTSTEKQ